MQVTLAGYNIDSSLIRTLRSEAATPEVISAAYARISRSSKSVTELRAEALTELKQARKSNQNIIFELGHASVAEHAVFNFDIIGISRLLTETLETLRFASFTEKSQRYVTFSKDYIVPKELDHPDHAALKELYIDVMDSLFDEYQASYKALKEHYPKLWPQLSPRDLDGRAKEDARYILPLATKTQLGMTLNARSLENLLRRLQSKPLEEASNLHADLLSQATAVCPSLVRHVRSESFTGSFCAAEIGLASQDREGYEAVQLLDFTPNADNRILSALLYEEGQADFADALKAINAVDHNARQRLWDQVFEDIRPWSKMPRAFELAEFSFELRMSESCWAQFKRHRVGTMIKQKSPSGELCVMPEEIDAIGRAGQWDELLTRLLPLREKLFAISPELAAYARLNADGVKVFAKMNLRELYHLIRLRCDEHAQWEINALSHTIAEKLRTVAPCATAFICGKSEFAEAMANPAIQKD